MLLILISPWLTGGYSQGSLIDPLICGVMLTGLYAASPRRRTLIAGTVLVAITIASHWLDIFIAGRAPYALHYILMLLALLFACRTILGGVIRDTRVTLETIKGAICIYLLIGLIWVFLFALVNLLIPGSFLIQSAPGSPGSSDLLVRHRFPELLCFSYSTMTTLGYGDILPLSRPAQTLCYLEAIVGQMYLTVLIARLVGMHITQPANDDRA
jgi:hypothetical protein